MLDLQEMPKTVTQQAPHESRSAKYSHVPTSDIVQWLGQYNFHPVAVRNTRARPDREGYQRHIVRFRHATDNAPQAVGDVIPEIVLRNAHDGTSGISLWSGLFRLICSNGLIVADQSFSKISLPHRGKGLRDKVIDAAYRVVDVSEKALTGVNEWRKIELSQGEKDEFAQRALALRFENAEESPIEHRQLLTIRRHDDLGSDLWTVFNRVQENLIRGGFAGVNRRNENGLPMARTLRGIRGGDRSIELNTELWQIADSIARVH